MRRWIKGLSVGVLALVVLAAAAVFTGLQLYDSKRQRTVQLNVQPVAARTDVQGLERGKYLFASRGCVDCHGANGAGRVFVDDGGVRLKGPNITNGTGGVVAGYKPEDWVRAIRHGVAPGGRPLMVMPSEDYNRLTNDDLSSLVGYARSLAAAPGGGAEVVLPLPARVLYGFGQIKDAAAKIDHSLAPQQPVAEGVTREHGAYVVNTCIGCHGPQLLGGRIPGGPPDWPPASRLAPGPGSVMAATYADAESMIRLFKSGKRADGSTVKVMPFESLREMSDTDVRALHLYLRGLQPAPRKS